MKYFVLLAMLLSLLSSCQNNVIEPNIIVRALNESKKPIVNADVYINNQFEGRTNSQGYFQKKIKAIENDRIIVQVQKDSDLMYYAPYFENTSLRSDQAEINISAILYSVPKPSEDKDSESKSEETPLSESSPAMEGIADSNEIAPITKPDDHNKKPSTPSVVSLPETALEEEMDFVKPAQNLEPKLIEKGLHNQMVSFYLKGYDKKQNHKIDILIGDPDKASYKSLCRVNHRGRCSVSLENLPYQKASLLIKGDGYRTTKIIRDISSGDKIHIPIVKGRSLDVQTSLLLNGKNAPLKNVRVLVDEHRLGETDRFGHFTSPIKGSKGRLIKVTLEHDQYTPSESSYDFVVGGNLALTKEFVPKNIPPIKLATAPVQIAGKLRGKTLPTFTEIMEQSIAQGLKKSLFSNKIFEGRDYKKIFSSQDLSKVFNDGWHLNDASNELYGIIVPTLIIHQTVSLELKIISHDGKSLLAAKREFHGSQNKSQIMDAVHAMSHEMINKFPYPSYVEGKQGDQFMIHASSLGVMPKIGSQFAITGTQSDPQGQRKYPKSGGLLRVSQIEKKGNTILAVLDKPMARAQFEIGDALVYLGPKKTSLQSFVLRVTDKDSHLPIPQVSIYFGQDWIGSTDQNGQLAGKFPYHDRNLLRAVKYGYQSFAKETKLSQHGQFEIKLKRASATLKLETIPPGMSVFMDKAYIGKTPLSQTLAVQSRFIKMEILGQNGYKNFQKIVSLDEGALNFTGDQAIVMEKDLKSLADQKLESGKIQEAIDILQSITEEHSDYLLAQHQVGTIYMTLLEKPHLAAAAFHKVTSHPDVNSFRDKRFIGSHINEGIALFLTGKDLEIEGKDLAGAHYQKAAQVLDKVIPFLRFIDEGEYQVAFDNLYYYKALSHQKLGSLNNNIGELRQSENDWNTLIKAYGKSRDISSLVKNAQIYKKQLTLALEIKRP